MKTSMSQSQKYKSKTQVKKGGFFDDDSDEDSEDGLGFLGSKRPI